MRRIPTLDGWRAVAILAVLWHHTMKYFFTDAAAYYRTPARFGAFGVDVFFGISGLLITWLVLNDWEKTGRLDLRAFYIRRAFRILPVYMVFLGVVAAAGLMNGPKELTSCLFFFRNYVPGNWRNTQHLWSLSVEEHFYLIWPGLLAICGLKWGRSAAAYLAIAIGFWRLMQPQLALTWLADLPPHFRTDLRMDALLWGAVTAFTLNDARAREKLRAQLQFWPWLGLVVLALASIVWYSSMSSMFLAVLIPVVLAGTLLHPEWLVSRVLDAKPMAWIGRISYSLYIWQQLFLVPGWEHPAHFWIRYPWNLAVILAVACASYYLLEVPLQRLGAELASGSRRSTARITRKISSEAEDRMA